MTIPQIASTFTLCVQYPLRLLNVVLSRKLSKLNRNVKRRVLFSPLSTVANVRDNFRFELHNFNLHSQNKDTVDGPYHNSRQEIIVEVMWKRGLSR